MEKTDYPMRINKYLAWQKICSRREADRLIEDGQVLINGKKAQLGEQVEKNSKVEIKNDPRQDYIYLAFNKPKNVITHSAGEGEREISDILNFPERVFPIGRLDKDSHGLIILTNDGRITERLLNSKNVHEKEYRVRVEGEVEGNFLRKMERGVVLDGQKTLPCRVQKKGEQVFSIILTEGKNRQIRRMCGFFGRAVQDLQRIRIENIKLGNLRSGQWRKIKGIELQEFLRSLDLD